VADNFKILWGNSFTIGIIATVEGEEIIIRIKIVARLNQMIGECVCLSEQKELQT